MPPISRLNRRQFVRVVAAGPLFMTQEATFSSQTAGGLTDVAGIRVGHFTHSRRPTGCTVVLVEKGATASVDVRGAAPGTRETDLLHPSNSVQQVHAILLSGGSAFGLEAAAGVVRYLEEKGVGLPVGRVRVPIVPAAILFDLGLGDPSIRPGPEDAYAACKSASDGPIEEGNVGAGAGATVGKLFGISQAMKSGLGSASLAIGPVVVAALVAVNAVGDVIDPDTGQILAGARTEDGLRLADTSNRLRTSLLPGRRIEGQNTTLAVVATNVAFSKSELHRIAQMSHDGLARSIRPVHMPYDGDAVFALSSGIESADLGQIGALAAEVTARAVVRAVLKAKGLEGFPAHSDLRS